MTPLTRYGNGTASIDLNHMELALAESFVQAAQPFVDGFGERRVIVDARGERLDVLRLNAELSGTPGFEAALHERVNRIAGFRHESYTRVRTIEVDRPTGTLLVVSDHVRGARLATLLACAEKRGVPVDVPTATCIVRQLVLATAAWRDQMPDTVHGAISPDRIMVTPEGQLILVDQVFGSALAQLRYPRQRYWEALGIALPLTFDVAIDACADVLQVGAVALALVLGRRLRAEDKVDQIQTSALDRVPVPFRRWLLKALQADPVGSFTSVTDARAALTEAFGEPHPIEQDGLLLFIARCLALDVNTPPFPTEEETRTTIGPAADGIDDVPDVDLGTRIEALKAFLARRSSRGESSAQHELAQVSTTQTLATPLPPSPVTPAPLPTAPVISTPLPPAPVTSAPLPPAPVTPPRQTSLPPDAALEVPLQTAAVATVAAAAQPAPVPVEPARRVAFQSRLRTLIRSRMPDRGNRRLWVGAAALAIITATALLIVAGTALWSRGPSTGSFSIDTRPPGAKVTIDGTPRGVTPLSLDLPAGDHLVEVVGENERRQIPLTIRAGSQTSQLLELTGAVATPAPTPNGSELRVRTEPIGAAVTVDGEYVGRSPVSVSDLAPGPHTVVMKHDSGTVTEQVLIEQGKAASLFVPLAVRPAPGAAAGWITVVGARADVQLYENGRFLGSNRIDRIMLPVGRHELEIVNEMLGFRDRRTVQVSAGQVSSVTLKWPTGGLSLNAVPWAQAFVDDALVGETPIANLQVPIGPHEITFRHPQLGERRSFVTVTARETARVGIDLRAKP